MSEPGPATLYKLGNLIKFYQGTIGSVHLSNYLQVVMHIIDRLIRVVWGIDNVNNIFTAKIT